MPNNSLPFLNLIFDHKIFNINMLRDNESLIALEISTIEELSLQIFAGTKWNQQHRALKKSFANGLNTGFIRSYKLRFGGRSNYNCLTLFMK